MCVSHGVFVAVSGGLPSSPLRHISFPLITCPLTSSQRENDDNPKTPFTSVAEGPAGPGGSRPRRNVVQTERSIERPETRLKLAALIYLH